MMRCATVLLTLLVFLVAAPSALAPDVPDRTDDLDEFFDLYPAAAVAETTGLEASEVAAATPREGGGAHVESAESLATEDGRAIEDVVNAEIDSSGNVISAEELEFEGALLRNTANFLPIEGGFIAEAAKEIVTDRYLLTGAEGVRFENGRLLAVAAESLFKSGAVATKMQMLNATAAQFSVSNADSVIRGCASLIKVRDATIVVYADAIEAQLHGPEPLRAIDCTYAEALFVAKDGSFQLSTAPPARYRVGPGRLTITNGDEQDTINVARSVEIEVEQGTGVSCVLLDAGSTYWFNAPDLVRDFGVHVPKNASAFRLCIRKSETQPIQMADGVVDLVNHSALLRKQVQLLKYPIKSGRPSSLLMDKLLHLSDGFQALLLSPTEDRAMLQLRRTEAMPAQPAITRPNNYLELREQPINETVHTLLRLDATLQPSSVDDARIASYRRGYEVTGFLIEGGVLEHTNDGRRVRVLGPDDEGIAGLVN